MALACILHLGKFYPPAAGGMERFLADLAEAQVRRGYRVAAVVHQHRRGEATAREVVDDVEVVRVRQWGELVYAPISPALPVVLGRICREFRPDLIHIHLPNVSAAMLCGVPVARKVPWVVHWHADVVASQIDQRVAAAYRLYRPFESAVLRRSKAVIATSQAYADSSLALRPWRKKVRVVPLGVNSSRLGDPPEFKRSWAESQWQPGLFRVLTVGRLTYYKGHDVLLDAATRSPGCQFHIVGGGGLHANLKQSISELGLQGRVVLHGYLDDRSIQALLSTCQVFTLPSIERTEAFGIVQMEAMRYGKPLVTADIPGSGVSVPCRDGVNGFLVPVGDAAALAEAIQSLERDPTLAVRLGEAGRGRFDHEFQIDNVAKSIGDIYAQVLR